MSASPNLPGVCSHQLNAARCLPFFLQTAMLILAFPCTRAIIVIICKRCSNIRLCLTADCCWKHVCGGGEHVPHIPFTWRAHQKETRAKVVETRPQTLLETGTTQIRCRLWAADQKRCDRSVKILALRAQLASFTKDFPFAMPAKAPCRCHLQWPRPRRRHQDCIQANSMNVLHRDQARNLSRNPREARRSVDSSGGDLEMEKAVVWLPATCKCRTGLVAHSCCPPWNSWRITSAMNDPCSQGLQTKCTVRLSYSVVGTFDQL